MVDIPKIFTDEEIAGFLGGQAQPGKADDLDIVDPGKKYNKINPIKILDIKIKNEKPSVLEPEGTQYDLLADGSIIPVRPSRKTELISGRKPGRNVEPYTQEDPFGLQAAEHAEAEARRARLEALFAGKKGLGTGTSGVAYGSDGAGQVPYYDAYAAKLEAALRGRGDRTQDAAFDALGRIDQPRLKIGGELPYVSEKIGPSITVTQYNPIRKRAGSPSERIDEAIAKAEAADAALTKARKLGKP